MKRNQWRIFFFPKKRILGFDFQSPNQITYVFIFLNKILTYLVLVLVQPSKKLHQLKNISQASVKEQKHYMNYAFWWLSSHDAIGAKQS